MINYLININFNVENASHIVGSISPTTTQDRTQRPSQPSRMNNKFRAFLKQDFARFSIQILNAKMHFKVLEWLRSIRRSLVI